MVFGANHQISSCLPNVIRNTHTLQLSGYQHLQIFNKAPLPLPVYPFIPFTCETLYLFVYFFLDPLTIPPNSQHILKVQ